MSSDDISDLIERAKALYEIRRYQDALAVLHRALAIEPDDVDVLCWITRAHFCRKDLSQALDYADRAVAAAPDEERGHRLRSCVLEELGRSAEAVQAAEEAVRLAPDEPLALEQLTYCYGACKRWEEALECAETVIELAPERAHSFWPMAWIYLQQKRWRQTETYARRTLAIDAEHTHALSGLGCALFEQGRHAEGMECLYRALQIDPTDTWTQRRLRAAIDQFGFASLDEFQRAQADPVLMEHAGRRGELKAQAQEKLNRQRAREAIPPLHRALSMAPEDLGLLDLLATAHTNSGDYRSAIEITDRMIRLAPNDGRGHWRRALALSRLATRITYDRDRLRREALRSSEEAVRAVPDDADYMFTLAALQLDRGLREEAERTAKRVIALAPYWESSYIIMARVYFDLKRWILVEVYLRQALQINPRNIGTLGTLARSLREQGKRREAAAIIKQALRYAFSPKPDRENSEPLS